MVGKKIYNLPARGYLVKDPAQVLVVLMGGGG